MLFGHPLIAFMPWNGMNQEDCVIISKSASDKYGWKQGKRLKIFDEISVWISFVLSDDEMPYFLLEDQIPEILLNPQTIHQWSWTFWFYILFINKTALSRGILIEDLPKNREEMRLLPENETWSQIVNSFKLSNVIKDSFHKAYHPFKKSPLFFDYCLGYAFVDTIPSSQREKSIEEVIANLGKVE